MTASATKHSYSNGDFLVLDDYPNSRVCSGEFCLHGEFVRCAPFPSSQLLPSGPPSVGGLFRHDVACCPQSEHFDTECCSPMDVGSLWGVPLDGRLL